MSKVSTPPLGTILFFVSLVGLALPLGLSNATCQILGAVLLLPFVWVCRRQAWVGAIVLFWLVSLWILRRNPADGNVWFQFMRSGAPLTMIVIFLVSYDTLSRKFSSVLSADRSISTRLMKGIVYIFPALQLIQVVAFKAGIPIANTVLFSIGDNTRVFLPQLFTSLMLVYFGVRSNRITIVGMAAVTILATGSKSAFACFVLLAFLALFHGKRLGAFSGRLFTIGIVGFFAIGTSALVLDRAHDYFRSDFSDITREWEISYAKEAFSADVTSVLFGVGVAKPLTPGALTEDPAWFENSRFDIENAYWSILAKLGVVGFGLILWLFSRLRMSGVVLALYVIELVVSLGSGYTFFGNFDGAFLIVWAALIEALLRPERRARPLTEASSHRSGAAAV
ncbi:O-antigen ligase family protein [Sphingomonas crusticola]|uniref:O-antigen ligase family protein n=1 Tax=Sphingomonas crusticola TaxID=1697973 RepID=UPI0013C367A4|nr:O-antigen ligase family protein [Sphingomonas crusticola]